MVKRPASSDVESDEDVEVGSSRQAKRARKDNNAQSGPSKRKNAKAEADEETEVGNEEEEENSDEENRVYEKKAEEQLEGQLADKVINRTAREGGVAEMGVIVSLEMFNFMCHKHLSFAFGPQINFIIGHNGSGKSAVLTALTVALGGKASATSRGGSLKSFIKEGENVSEVSVVIKNKGHDAYFPDKYGDAITITRHFTRDGSSSYKIKGALSDKTLSTKREELSSICDHMNIQVDNPMNVLTQDTARQFLSAAKPKDKYDFFLKGTQLAQLTSEYENIRENIRRASLVLEQKRGILGELEKNKKEADTRYREAQKARDQRTKVDTLECEKAWSYIAGKEKEVRQQRDKVSQAERVLPDLITKYEKAKDDFDTASRLIEENEALLRAESETCKPLENQRKENNNIIKTKKKDLQDIKNEEQQMNVSLNTVKRSLEDYERQIEEETRKLAESSREKRERLEARLTDARQQLADLKAAEAEHAQQQEDIRKRGNMAREASDKAKSDRDILKNKIDTDTARIFQLERQREHSINAFGNNMVDLLRAIQREEWRGATPVGPFGQFVDVKMSHGAQWASLLRMVVGNMMNAFAITNSLDRPKLKGLLEKYKNYNVTIIVAQQDMFDYPEDLPQDVVTVLRTLEIRDPWVLRILINSNHIERSILCKTGDEAHDLFKNRLRNQGVAFCKDNRRIEYYSDTGYHQTKFASEPAGGDWRMNLFPGPNKEEAITGLRQRKTDAEQRYRELSQCLMELNAEMAMCDRDAHKMQAEGVAINKAVRSAQSALNQVEAELHEDEPASMDALNDAKTEALREKQSIMDQFVVLQDRRVAIEDEIKPLVAANDSLREKISTFEKRKQELTAATVEGAGVRLQAQNDRNYYQKKIEESNYKVLELRAALDVQQAELENWTRDCIASFEKFENPRKTEVVEREIVALNKALQEREMRDGASVEDMAKEVERTTKALATAKSDIEGMGRLHTTLNNSLTARQFKWHAFRRHIAVRAKIQFQFHLSKRGYFGKLNFDHVSGTLDLKVQTDDQVGTQAKREKDPKSLSGGEKSFSTIYEFDVFMDAVNRRISMNMMTSTAKQSAGTQYILITPQDMSNVSLGPETRVHRMNDPERGQGLLNFNN